MSRRRYTKGELEALLNWDGFLCKPPWRNRAEECQYYARFIERMLWDYLTERDWHRLADIVDDLRVDPKLKRATRFLVARHV